MPSPAINRATTFSAIPSFVPVGVLWYTNDTLKLYAGTGVSDNGGTPGVSAVGGIPNAPASIVTVTQNYQPSSSDGTILVNGNYTITLATNLTTGTTFRIKNIGASAVYLSTAANLDGQTGSTAYTLNPYQYASVDVQFDGTNWWIL